MLDRPSISSEVNLNSVNSITRKNSKCAVVQPEVHNILGIVKTVASVCYVKFPQKIMTEIKENWNHLDLYEKFVF